MVMKCSTIQGRRIKAVKLRPVSYLLTARRTLETKPPVWLRLPFEYGLGELSPAQLVGSDFEGLALSWKKAYTFHMWPIYPPLNLPGGGGKVQSRASSMHLHSRPDGQN